MNDVTVLMPVYNGLPYLPEAVQSILSQTLRNLTLLVVDDGSTDGSRDYLSLLKDPRVRVQSIPHSGLGAALSTGVEMCTTEFIARMDADDIALPRRLELQLGYLKTHDDIGLLGTQVAYFGHGISYGFSPPLYRNHARIVSALMKGDHSVCHASMMCRTAALKSVGGYRIRGPGQDWDMFLRMAETCQLANLEEVLYLYRLHSRSINAVQLEDARLHRAFACDCALQRSQGRPDKSFAEFLAQTKQRSLLKRAGQTMDLLSLQQYRLAIAEILDDHSVKGYARLLLAAGMSPHRVIQRLMRSMRWRS